MATDHYGNYVGIGDTVIKVGYSTSFVITGEADTGFGVMLTLNNDNWEETNVPPDNVIKT